jgi:hypothetical protein
MEFLGLVLREKKFGPVCAKYSIDESCYRGIPTCACKVFYSQGLKAKSSGIRGYGRLLCCFLLRAEESWSPSQFALSIARVKVMRHIAKIMLWKTYGGSGLVVFAAGDKGVLRWSGVMNHRGTRRAWRPAARYDYGGSRWSASPVVRSSFFMGGASVGDDLQFRVTRGVSAVPPGLRFTLSRPHPGLTSWAALFRRSAARRRLLRCTRSARFWIPNDPQESGGRRRRAFQNCPPVASW